MELHNCKIYKCCVVFALDPRAVLYILHFRLSRLDSETLFRDLKYKIFFIDASYSIFKLQEAV